MRKKDDFSWIIYLLLMKYALSEDTCERGTCLGQLSFGEFLPLSAFTTKYQISPYQCATECQLRIQRCKSFNYRRSALSCQLCEEDSGQGGKNLQPKAGSIHSNIDTWKNIPIKQCNTINCSWTERCDPSIPVGENACVPTECPFAELKLGMTIEPSNETAVRTKARRRCMSQNMERGDPITTCLESEAKWSNPDFKCVCATPPARSGTINGSTELEVGQNYTYICQDGLVAKAGQNPTVTCLPDGSWTSTNFICVCTSPPAKTGTIQSTIDVKIGQNYTYKCQAGLLANAGQDTTVTCLPDGSWTSTNFTCVCPTPSTKFGAINEMAKVEVGQNYTYRCQTDLIKKGDEKSTVTCLPDGSWTATNFACVRQNWMQDKIYPNNIHKSDAVSNDTGIDLFECMQRCDNHPINCLSFFYDNHNNRCVLSSSFQRGIPQGFQFSEGVVYYTAPSASCDMGYSNVSLGGSYVCIKFHGIRQTFNEGMKRCELEKAKILVVTTLAQITDAHTFLGKSYGCTFAGVSDETKEGTWSSWDGKTVYPVWNPTEPNGQTNENCGVIDFLNHGLFDLSCHDNCNFLCYKFNL